MEGTVRNIGMDIHRVAAEVDADDLEGLAIEVEHGGWLAGAGVFALSGLDDEALGHELGDEVGDGDAGEPGLASQVGTALEATSVEGLQDEGAVVAARVLRQDLRAGTQRTTAGEARDGGASLRGVR